MKKHLTTMIVVATAAIHAHSADLASLLRGYWQTDMEKALALARKANREVNPVSEAMMGRMLFEFQNDKLTVRPTPSPCNTSNPSRTHP